MGELLSLHILHSVKEKPLIKACSKSWKVNPERAKKVKYVLAVDHDTVLRVFEIKRTKKSKDEGKTDFLLEDAPDSVQEEFIGKSVKTIPNSVHYILEKDLK